MHAPSVFVATFSIFGFQNPSVTLTGEKFTGWYGCRGACAAAGCAPAMNSERHPRKMINRFMSVSCGALRRRDGPCGSGRFPECVTGPRHRAPGRPDDFRFLVVWKDRNGRGLFECLQQRPGLGPGKPVGELIHSAVRFLQFIVDMEYREQ